MATLRTPTDGQWRKLCEMAGWKCYGNADVDVPWSEGRVRPMFFAGDFNNLIQDDTDALMRLCDAVFTEWSMTCRNFVLVCASIVGEELHTTDYRLECCLATPNKDDGRRKALCDILAQLVEALGCQ